MLRLIFLLLLILVHVVPGFARTISSAADRTSPPNQSISWTDWSDDAFEKAKKENKFVILDLEAVWCHWCHVMNQQTYGNAAVAKLINAHFIALRVDQDSRPDLSNRYQEYGWPATIIFAPSGLEIAKRAGYIPPGEMSQLLRNIVRHSGEPELKPEELISQKSAVFSATTQTAPPGPAVGQDAKPYLPTVLRTKLQKECFDGYDATNAGWGTEHKYMDGDTVEFCLVRAQAGDAQCAQMAKDTLKAAGNLIDPIWGGVYQYSTDGDWHHPHFEKIMQMQGEDMRIFTLAYQLWHDPAYLQAAKEIEKFLHLFLTSPSAAFYTSMDADLIPGTPSKKYFALHDTDRRKKGIPKIDKHCYSRENGWAINGLVALYAATDDQTYLDQAVSAANWVIANRSLADGGFRHDQIDKAGPYLSDTLSMGRAFLALYAATADRRWLTHAEQCASFIGKHFPIPTKDGSGYATAEAKPKQLITPEPLVDENVMLTAGQICSITTLGTPVISRWQSMRCVIWRRRKQQ